MTKLGRGKLDLSWADDMTLHADVDVRFMDLDDRFNLVVVRGADEVTIVADLLSGESVVGCSGSPDEDLQLYAVDLAERKLGSILGQLDGESVGAHESRVSPGDTLTYMQLIATVTGARWIPAAVRRRRAD
ncbi:hypothetical protein [Planctomonas psychrotolerans]|uniref:hypothetical protein n=1 Tax=Planctomonas psychrotolerans TaxID=2528712 RepID=UPI001D0D09A7|nr:hypothetical protein [Planctomonas psychrotolerans]